MSELTLTAALRRLHEATLISARQQMLDPNHPLHGSYISPGTGMDDAGAAGTAGFIASCGLLLANSLSDPESLPAIDRADLLHRIDIAADYLLRAQRPSGLIDLRIANYDSSPDAAFAVQVLSAMYQQAHGLNPDLDAVLAKLETFIRKAVDGILTGGFHTPNHRWVIVSALALAATLFPDLDVRAVVEAYLAEGFDISDEGTYIERSVGVYDAITDRALLLLADHWPDAQIQATAQAAVTRNLNLDLYLLHDDGTAETGLSHRQDFGTRTVPVGLISCYLHSAARTSNPFFASAAHWLWAKADQPADFWVAYVLKSVGMPTLTDTPLPTDYTHFYPQNRIWRARRKRLNTSAFGGTTRLITLVYGEAELSSIKISQSYFGVGRFVADEMEADEHSILLHSRGDHSPYRPAYELPLGRPVAPDQWEATKAERQFKTIPRVNSILRITVVDDGLELHYRTLDGLDDATAQIALDFPAGGIWETDDTALQTQPGQIIFLKQNAGRMRFGHDIIEINPGANGHRTWHMRDTEEAAPGLVRVLIPLITPVDHRFRLRVYSAPISAF
ncbi:MAG: hypothetical protein K8L99_14885 [Anaerolineae bacterium]|nr:hypothetical protein [Anaerolineae bacterium]